MPVLIGKVWVGALSCCKSRLRANATLLLALSFITTATLAFSMSEEVNIFASQTTVDDILSRSHRFEVPDYQRQYSWNGEQWSDLWEDVNSIGPDQMHFFGSIVVISGAYEPTGSTILQLVDGQQRLSTISIFLCALKSRYRELGELEEGQNAMAFEKYLWDIKFREENSHPRVSLGQLDHEDYIQVLEGHPDRVTNNERIRDAYYFFYSKIESYSVEELDEIRDRLLNQISVVMIRSNSESSAFRLFETLNDRGLELSAVDLMKNHLLSVAHDDPKLDATNIKEDWKQLLITIRDLDKPIRFFRHYLMSTPNPKTNQRITESKVYDRFKSIVLGIQRREEFSLEDFVAEMERQSKTYVAMAEANIRKFSPHKNGQVNDRLDALIAIGAIPARTLMLRTFYELDDPDKICDILQLIESLMLRWNISRYSTGSEVDKLFNRLSHEAFNQSDPVEYIRNEFLRSGPTNDEFKRNFARKNHRQNDLTKYILDTIEREQFMASGEGKRIKDRMNVHIEHIAPRQTFSANKYSSWIDYLEVDEQTFMENRNRIGNLTLFERRLNIKALDNPFEQKQEYYETSDFEMTRVLCEYDSWSIEKIKDRSREFAEIAAIIWSLE